jgi:hypothetical protein
MTIPVMFRENPVLVLEYRTLGEHPAPLTEY